MKYFIHKFVEHPLITGSTIVFVGSFFANVLSFFFNLYMAAHLTLVDYGSLASLVSLITLFAYAANAINPAVVQFAGSYFANNDMPAVKSFYLQAIKLVLLTGFITFGALILFSPAVSMFLKLSSAYLLLVTNITIFIGFIFVVHMSFLQAKLAFTEVAVTQILSAAGKLLFGIVFVYLGYGIHGAVTAILFASLLPLIFTLYPLRFLIHEKSGKEISNKRFFSYGVPTVFSLLSLIYLIYADILLVKHFFPAETAGQYSGLSLVGRVIFYFTAPIGMVMFPMVVNKFNKKENYTSVFLLSLVLVFSASAAISFFYFLFPEFSILLFLKKTEYLTVAPLLGGFSIFMTLYAIISVLLNFYLSIRKTGVVFPICAAAVLQIFLINFYHASLSDVIVVSISILLLLLLVLLLYYPYATKKK